MCVSAKNAKLKRVKKIGMLVGVCAPFASREWYQKDIATIIEEEACDVEIKIEDVCQQDHVGRAVVVHATADKEEDIETKLINKHN